MTRDLQRLYRLMLKPLYRAKVTEILKNPNGSYLIKLRYPITKTWKHWSATIKLTPQD